MSKFSPPLSLDELQRFCDSVAVCLDAGLPLTRALRLGVGEAKASSSSSLLESPLAALVERLIKGLDAGRPLPELLNAESRFFPSCMLALIESGVGSGKLAESFRAVADFCRTLIPSRRQMLSSLIYPAFMTVTALFLIFLLRLLTGSLFSALTGLLIQVMLLSALIFGIRYALTEPGFKLSVDRLRLLIPLWSRIELENANLLYFKTLQFLYQAGGFSPAVMLEISARAVPNLWLRSQFARAARSVETAGRISIALAGVSVVLPQNRDLVAIGEESGTLDSTLAKIVELSSSNLCYRLEVFNKSVMRLAALALSLLVFLMALLSLYR